LPDNFDQWDLADHNGTTVAHIAAAYGHLPDDFSQWDLVNNNGVTVAELAKSFDEYCN
jgi:hypothetical protein